MLSRPRFPFRTLAYIVVASVILTLFLQACGAAIRPAHADGNTPQAVPGQQLVKVRRGALPPAGATVPAFLTVSDGAWYVVRAASAAEVQATTADVLAIEPNIVVTVDDDQAAPATNDPLSSQQYSLTNMAVPQAWQIADGSAATIYVLDTGAFLAHPDLAVTRGPDFVQGDNDPADVQGHGTHVIGIATAKRDNGVGVAGVSRAKAVAVRVLGDNGSGSFDGIVRGMQWASDQSDSRKIVSMSLGARGQYQVMADAVAYARSRNTLVIAAAGNASTDAPHSPAIYADLGVIAVGQDNRIAGFSNFGSNGNISAPGVNVLSTMMTSGPDLTNPTGYGTLSGTSMATPNVAGVAALAWSAHKDYTAAQIAQLLRATATSAPGDSYHYGSGIVNAYAAVTGITGPAPTPPPAAPAPTPTTSPTTKWSRDLFDLLNAQRIANNLSALPWSDALANAAHGHNISMNQCAAAQGINSCFSHQLPGEPDPFQRMKNAGWPGSGMEDIGYGYTSPEAMVRGWMQSPGHRAAILAPNATAFGPDFLDGSGQGKWQAFFWTLDVGTQYTPPGTTPPPTPTPDPRGGLPSGYEMRLVLDYDLTSNAATDDAYFSLCGGPGVTCSWTPKPTRPPYHSDPMLPAGWLMTVVLDYSQTTWQYTDTAYSISRNYYGVTATWRRK